MRLFRCILVQPTADTLKSAFPGNTLVKIALALTKIHLLLKKLRTNVKKWLGCIKLFSAKCSSNTKDKRSSKRWSTLQRRCSRWSRWRWKFFVLRMSTLLVTTTCNGGRRSNKNKVVFSIGKTLRHSNKEVLRSMWAENTKKQEALYDSLIRNMFSFSFLARVFEISFCFDLTKSVSKRTALLWKCPNLTLTPETEIRQRLLVIRYHFKGLGFLLLNTAARATLRHLHWGNLANTRCLSISNYFFAYLAFCRHIEVMWIYISRSMWDSRLDKAYSPFLSFFLPSLIHSFVLLMVITRFSV